MRRTLLLILILSVVAFSALTQESVSIGDTIEATASGANVEYTFEGTTGDVVTISLESDEFDAFLEIFNAAGESLTSDDDGGESTNSLVAFTVPEDGTYTIVVSSFFGEPTGNYTLSLAGVETTAIAYGGSATAQFNGAEPQFFSFEGTEGDIINIFADSGDARLDTEITLLGPDSVEVANDDDSGSGTEPAILREILPATGSYTIVLGPSFDQELVGVVNLTVEETELLTLDEGPITLMLGEGAFEADVVRFTAEANQVYRLTVRSTDGLSTGVRISINPDDFSQPRTEMNNAIGMSFDFRASADGLTDILFSAGFFADRVNIEVSIEPVE